MDDKTGMDRLARKDWFCKEDTGGRVLCFYQIYSFLSFFHWFFMTEPTPSSAISCDTSQCDVLVPSQSLIWSVD